VEVLLQAYPAGGTAADPRTGFLPLHTACQSGATLAVIRALLSSSPEATKAVDIQGRLPVHVAVVQAAAYTVVEAMVEHDPDSAVALDQDGNTPLDYAVQCYGRNHVVVELLTMVGVFLQETSI
jgi:ankyrin repeat protein